MINIPQCPWQLAGAMFLSSGHCSTNRSDVGTFQVVSVKEKHLLLFAFPLPWWSKADLEVITPRTKQAGLSPGSGNT